MGNVKVFSRRFLEFGKGKVPIILSCPHGGYKKPKFISDIEKGARFPDRNTLFLAKRIINLMKIKDRDIYYIFSKIHRSKVDLNRPPGAKVAFQQSSAEAREFHHAYQTQIIDFTKQCISSHDKCLIIDFHGFTKPNKEYCDIIFGNIFSNTLSIKNDGNNEGYKKYWGLKQFITEFSRDFSLDDGLGETDLNLAYSGGYITHQFYRKEKINALQIEIADNIRKSLDLSNIFVDDFVKAMINCLT